MDQADRLRAMSFVKDGSRSTRIISVTSGKGGVGKTNIAVNLAVLFARRGLKVLLIDADLGLANTNILLGCKVGNTLDDVMFGQIPIKEVFIKTSSGFDLLPGSSGIRKLLQLDIFAQRVLFDRLFEAMQGYDIVIYDTAPGIGSHVLNFNATAHDIVIVSHPEPTALADAYALVKVLATEKREKKFKLLVNRTRGPQDGLDTYKRLTDVSEEFLNISIDYLGALPEDLSLLRSVKIQKPVTIDAPRAPFCVALERVSDKLLASSLQLSKSKVWNTEQVQTRIGEVL